jgi:hypothetical protein
MELACLFTLDGEVRLPSVDLGFLARRLFRRKTARHEPWIYLDLLGFSRRNLDFSMGYNGFSRTGFFRSLSLAVRDAVTEARGRGHTEGPALVMKRG